MAKGARRKTKWVSLSLANTTTSVATGSDSEQQPHQQSHHHHGGLRQKTLNGAGTTTKYSSSSKELAGGADSSEEHHSNEPLDTQSGHRTDTSGSGSGSDCPNGYSSSERRPGGAYHRRRPPPYHTRSSWTAASGTGSVTNGRGTYNGGNRTGYYNGAGGGGYYGAGRRSYYDTHTRRPANATGTNKTTSGEGDGGGGGTTINDDEYTRITTPRQDVLFKKGYLSRPKPTTATTTTTTTTSTSNENTASSSIAGTTSDGSDNGGNGGGSNSISTTASITSEFGGSFAADGSPLYDYPYPLLPCGYFTENGVLVMNGFAVDNNGYSYFNGGQTYIYPPNFNNCQQQPPATPVDLTDSMPCTANDETNANNPDDLPVPLATEGESQTSAESAVVVDSRVDVGAGGDGVGNPSAAEDSCEVLKQAVVDISDSTESQDGAPAPDANAVDDGGVAEGEVAVMPSAEVPDYENGFYQFTDGYDFAQFWSSIYYPSWLMEQYPLYDDTGAPIYYAGEYPMPNGDVYTQQTSFKRRKKRFRTFEEIAGENGAAHDLGDTSSSMMHEGNSASDEAATVLPATGCSQTPQEYQLNVDVQEFQPAIASTPLQNGDKVSPEGNAAQLNKNHSPRVTKKPPPAVKLPKTSSKTSPTPAVGQTNGTITASSERPTGAAMSHKIRKKDLIESTLAFAEQNIDLTRSKALASGPPSLDSELDCWTTIDRNGRKKRQEKVDVVKEKQVPANGEHRVAAEKIASLSPIVVELSSAPIAAISSSSSSALDTDTTIAIGPLDTSNKKDQQITKSKKKTKSNKRQQHRKPTGALHKQHKQEGFQLIEPEFPSVTSLGRQRARGGCDNVANEDDQLETNDSQEEQEQIEERVMKESVQGKLLAAEEETAGRNAKEDEETAFTLEGIEEQRKEDECIEEEEEHVTSEELNCDKVNETVPAEAPHMSPVEVIGERQEPQDLVLATPSPPPSSAMAVVEEPIIVKKTENVMHQQQQQEQADDEEQMVDTQEEQSSASVLSTVIVEQKEGTIEEEGPIVEPQASAVEEPVPEDEKLDGTQSHLAGEEQRVEMSTDRCVLTNAAKQLALGERPSLQLAKENDSDDAVEEDLQPGDAGGSDEDESRGKRGSVSGSVGYTESIDSGLQSPVSPCGGVTSPEASSMVSSIESDETPLDQAQSEAPLSQIVAKWLLRKLEVHEPEEVFVLPSDPLLIERLERFQLLQRRSSRLRGGTFSSDSEDDVDGGSQEDSDSDYMSDGQGRMDRTAHGDMPNSNSPVLSVPPEAPSPIEDDRTSQKQLNAKITHHRSVEQEAVPMKPPVLNPSDSRSINSPAGAPRGAAASASTGDAKRCVIM